MAQIEQLKWNSAPSQLDREGAVAKISDGMETHYAAVPEGMSLTQAIDDYVRSYDAMGYTAPARCTARLYRGGADKSLIEERDFAIAPPPRTVAINGGWS